MGLKQGPWTIQALKSGTINIQKTKKEKRKKKDGQLSILLYHTKRPLTFLHGIPGNPLVAKGILCATLLIILATLVRNVTTNI